MKAEHVLICGELAAGELAPITRQLLAGGRELADQLGEELHVVLLGVDLSRAARDALACGADKVYTVCDARLAHYSFDLHAKALAAVATQQRPRHLLFGHTDSGAELAPRLALRLGAAVTTDCTALAVGEGGVLLCTKPVYGGLAVALYAAEGFPQLASVRPNSMLPLPPTEGAGPIIALEVELDSPQRITLVDKVVEQSDGLRFEDAETIVAGGRGIGNVEGFLELKEVARLLKGVVGASRVACDNGWISTAAQVGITGKIVAPKLYLAVGISGASQHMSGCSRARCIVAINKDASAPIFKYAHYGLVGDWRAALTAFAEQLRTMA